MSTLLSVNLNKIALIRNSREGNNPDLIEYARATIKAGAQGITVHPRPDQRHIRADDCAPLKRLASEYNLEFNIEGNPFAGPNDSGYPGFLELVEQCKPEQTTLVPDSDDQLTSDHGFDLSNAQTVTQLKPLIQRIKDAGSRVSLFMDPDPSQMKLAAEIGADRVELYTGPFADHFDEHSDSFKALYQRYCDTKDAAIENGLQVNAGHDLNLDNLAYFVAMGDISEVSIGHALTIDSLHFGLESAMRRYLTCLA